MHPTSGVQALVQTSKERTDVLVLSIARERAQRTDVHGGRQRAEDGPAALPDDVQVLAWGTPTQYISIIVYT